LRRLAAQKIAREAPGHPLQPTALVHEAFLRLATDPAGEASGPCWEGRAHFFFAAAEAMRRILVEEARRKVSLKRGGGRQTESLGDIEIAMPDIPEDLLALDAALDKLEEVDGRAAQLTKLRYFSGLTLQEAAELLGVSRRTAGRLWSYARAWLYREVRHGSV
jgi:RNA polymerase sigma factor (TIGR02999 family)